MKLSPGSLEPVCNFLYYLGMAFYYLRFISVLIRFDMLIGKSLFFENVKVMNRFWDISRTLFLAAANNPASAYHAGGLVHNAGLSWSYSTLR